MRHILSRPNQITYIRILLIPVFAIFLLMEIPYKDYIAAFIFIVLSLSDALDGYIARKKQQITGIGKILDPIADKLLISTALIFLIGRIPLWMVVVIIVRELVITIARIFFLPKKVTLLLAHLSLGKKTRTKQIYELTKIINNIKNPVILMGDFNTFNGEEEIKKLLKETHLHNRFQMGLKSQTYTQPTFHPSRRLDYILTSKRIKVRNYEVLNFHFSDHLPLLVDFKVI